MLNSNPPLTPVEPLRTTPFKQEREDGEVTHGLGVQLSPGLPPASHSMGEAVGIVDEIFVELVGTEESFLAELETMEEIICEILVPLEVVGQEWTETARNLKTLHAEFVTQLNGKERTGITREVLKEILRWVLSLMGGMLIVSLRFRRRRIGIIFCRFGWDWMVFLRRGQRRHMSRDWRRLNNRLYQRGVKL